MNEFPIQIDATSLFYRFFAIPNVADQMVSSRKVQTFQFAPGSYSFQVASALFADFSFTVMDDGTVDFDATCDGFLKGRGTSTLTILGLEVTLDARQLTSADPANPNATGIILAGTTLEPGEDWITFRTVRLVPGKGNQLQQGSAQVANFTFDLKRDGTFAYEPSMDSSQGGFLAGNGTSTLTLLGYTLAVDATAVSNLLIIQPLRFFPASNTGKSTAVLLPADGFTLQLASGISNLIFNVELKGNITFDASLGNWLKLENEAGQTVLTVRDFEQAASAIRAKAKMLASLPGQSLSSVAMIGDGYVGRFEGCDIYYSPKTEAHEVHGDIRAKYTAIQGPLWLGLPLTDETGTPDGIGRFNRFEGGMIYWTPTTGAHEVHGAILERWGVLGFERSYLGYPTSDEEDWNSPIVPGLHGRLSLFQYGQILWQDGIIESPDTKNDHQDVVTPAGTALGGWVDITLRSDGSYTISYHMHDSGAIGYDFAVRAIFVATNGMSFAGQHSGHVGGTFSSGSSDDDFTEPGFNVFIRGNWAAVKDGRLIVTKEYSATGVVGFIEDVAKAVLDIAAGAAGATLGVVIGLGREIGQVFGNLGIGGTFGVIAGVVVFATGGGIVFAVVTGVGVGLVTNALIKQRSLLPNEAKFAAQVFGNSLPAPDQIILTNMSGLGGRAFTMPGVDGKIYVNLADAYDNPLQYTNGAYPSPGQVLIHELTHAWQNAHASFLPGLVCEGIVNQANFQVGQSVYQYGPPGPIWSAFNLEAQGAIVDQWFGGTQTAVVPNRAPMDEGDPYFVYIRDNIKVGLS